MYLDAEYVSNWGEGEVTTSCSVNLMTGEVHDIETSDEHDHFEHHLYDEVVVDIGSKRLTGRVDSDNGKIQDLDLMIFKSEAMKALKGNQK